MPNIRLETWAGHLTTDKRREIVETFTRETCRMLGCVPEAVDVIITEIPKENWGTAGELCSEKFPDK
ncbi:tautomerase family protein [Pseudodesulfovibrio tunisiensis]|uniref:tautomerase family protein n=1 Tax=Pseudodesulfovibrio tunisiensis TaxID=463192 RepID=UPI001FB2E9DB|nr:tautomerase family protein [Pseudodesulfovibrio tunisiensis]